MKKVYEVEISYKPYKGKSYGDDLIIIYWKEYLARKRGDKGTWYLQTCIWVDPYDKCKENVRLIKILNGRGKGRYYLPKDLVESLDERYRKDPKGCGWYPTGAIG